MFIFEKINIKIFKSKKNLLNVQHIYIYYNIYNFFFFLKNMLLGFYAGLVEVAGFDIRYLNLFNFFFLKNSMLTKIINYNYYNFKTNNRCLLFFIDMGLNISIVGLYNNAGWLERELIEFFKINFLKKQDTRNLLLDYNYIGNPLLKNYPTEGFTELFFNFYSLNVEYVNCDFIKL